MERDEALRNACFLSLDVLRARVGDDIPYRDGLDQGFPFRGRRVAFLNYQKGIYRAVAQSGPAALSINTSFKSPYDDEATEDGFLYAYRSGAVDQPDNRALRACHTLGVPIVYFIGTEPGRYRPEYPCYVTNDDAVGRRVVVSPGRWIGPPDDRDPVPTQEGVERRYAVREVRTRLHQARFRGIVIPAYREQCAICRLKERKLLDAAHIVADARDEGDAAITNGLSLCSIHHRAFDEDLVGISPDFEVHVSRRLLDDDDGPMLELLKGFHRGSLTLPTRRRFHPDRERLARRFEQFVAT